MKLVIAEKPDIAKAVSKVVNGSPRWCFGYIEQGEYCITWCYGHLLELKQPEDYGEEYARHNTPNERLPIFFENWGLKISEDEKALLKDGKRAPNKKKQVEMIGKLLKKASLVIVAGDIDDEGQLLVEEILEWHRYAGPIKRLDTGALNEESLKRAMSNLMDNDSWHKKAVSARARSVADFTLGINGSRFFSNLYHANLSIGRVQTAALALVVNRDKTIENHVAQKYYLMDMVADIESQFDCPVRFEPAKDSPVLVDGRIIDKSLLEKLAFGVTGKRFKGQIRKEQVREPAPLPLSISALKTYCFNKYGITPEETLTITQSLRMNYGGLITYNRSECRYLPENMHKEAPGVIAAVQNNLGAIWNFEGLNPAIKSRAFNNKNVNVHHAIIPTRQEVDITKLTEGERKVYKAICGFYMIQFLPACERERTKLTIPGKGGNVFTASSVAILSKGFRTVMGVDNDAPTPLSDFSEGEYTCTLKTPKIVEKETAPPKRYTDTSLEEDMKSVAKYVTDPDVKNLLLQKDKDSKEENGSIGTAATRSAIINTLKKRKFLCNNGKRIISTGLGREFIKILPDEFVKPDLTAKWWAIQQDIQEGKATPKDLYNDVLEQFGHLAAREYPPIDLSSLSVTAGEKSVGKCPRCGMPVTENSKAFRCSGYKRGCGFTIWKEGKFGVQKALTYSGRKLTGAMVSRPLDGKKAFVRGLKSERTGKTYDAYLILEDTGSSVFLKFDFAGVPKKKSKEKKV